MKGITKRFPGITANDHVDFELAAGEIHALLGENGAGKSTLMSILSGLYYPDEGEIILDGKPVIFNSPQNAGSNRIGMIYQHFMLVESHTVAENIILGSHQHNFFLQNPKIEEEIRKLSESYQLSVDPGAFIWQLSVGEQQRVEILKALYRNARILIMDEPTAVLTPNETRELFSTLRRFVESGNSVVFISHKLEEVMAIAHRVTVLKAGKVVGTKNTRETSREELATMMVGREIAPKSKKGDSPSCETALEIRDIFVTGGRGIPVLNGLSLTIRKGEILGVAGVAGNGQRELTEALNGLRLIKSGTIKVYGKEITNMSPRSIHCEGVAFIPEDRLGMGLVSQLEIEDNMALRDYWAPPFSRGPFLETHYIRQFTTRLIEEYGIALPRRNAPVSSLSGGNLQKILLSRELSGSPGIIVAAYPTRGLDIGAVEFVHKRLLEAKERGAAVLLISEDLDEILNLADTIVVLYEGRIVGDPVARDAANIEEIGLLMSGAGKNKSGREQRV